MKILGIDPGIGRCGWGIIEAQGSRFEGQNYGCMETKSDEEIEKRLKIVYGFVDEIIKQFKPDTLALEDLFFNTNAKTAFIVGQARGVVLLAASKNNIPVAVYTPLQVKIAVVGYGRAHKMQVGQMVKTILGLKSIPKLDDTADALAIALCHAFSAKMNKLSR